jgi:tRNA A-37 threonylcarbamoyl transferase component Bud32
MDMVLEQALLVVPVERRDTALDALSSAFGHTTVTEIQPVTGGASGALIYRIGVGERSYLMRMERERRGFHNPHQYACMQIAAEAGIAPRLLHLDPDKGVVIMEFVPSRSLTEYVGGPAKLAHALGDLIARLQATRTFPQLYDYPLIVGRMFGFVRSSGLFADGLLDPHFAAFERIRQACPWDASTLVSSHNDPNPRNIIFDGERLWLIDWETAYRNDPLVDVAILMENFGSTQELRDALLHGWLGRLPDRRVRARLTLIRQLTRLYYAGILLSRAAAAKPSVPDADLRAPSEAEFRAAIARGELTLAAPETLYVLGKMLLAAFMTGLTDAAFEDALVIAHDGG